MQLYDSIYSSKKDLKMEPETKKVLKMEPETKTDGSVCDRESFSSFRSSTLSSSWRLSLTPKYTELLEKEAEIKIREEYQWKEEEIKKRKQVLDKKEDYLLRKEEKCLKKEESFNMREIAIAEEELIDTFTEQNFSNRRLSFSSNRSGSFMLKNKDFSKQESVLAERLSEVERREEYNKKVKGLLKQKETRLVALEIMLSKRLKDIRELEEIEENYHVQKLEMNLHELSLDIKADHEQLQKQRKVMKRNESTIHSLNQVVRRSEEELEQLRNRISFLQNELRSQKDIVKKVNQSLLNETNCKEEAVSLLSQFKEYHGNAMKEKDNKIKMLQLALYKKEENHRISKEVHLKEKQEQEGEISKLSLTIQGKDAIIKDKDDLILQLTNDKDKIMRKMKHQIDSQRKENSEMHRYYEEKILLEAENQRQKDLLSNAREMIEWKENEQKSCYNLAAYLNEIVVIKDVEILNLGQNVVQEQEEKQKKDELIKNLKTKLHDLEIREKNSKYYSFELSNKRKDLEEKKRLFYERYDQIKKTRDLQVIQEISELKAKVLETDFMRREQMKSKARIVDLERHLELRLQNVRELEEVEMNNMIHHRDLTIFLMQEELKEREKCLERSMKEIKVLRDDIGVKKDDAESKSKNLILMQNDLKEFENEVEKLSKILQRNKDRYY